jgi:hypothetical protein
MFGIPVTALVMSWSVQIPEHLYYLVKEVLYSFGTAFAFVNMNALILKLNAMKTI